MKSNLRWWYIFPLLGVAVGVVALTNPSLLAGLLSGDGSKGAFKNRLLEGTFRASSETLGTWTVSPRRCVDGKERGFVGLAYIFAAGDPVDEIRIDTARDGDNVVEVRLADGKGTKLRVRERDCRIITGRITRRNVSINGRHMFRLEGETRFNCPQAKISGEARFDGCLPQEL